MRVHHLNCGTLCPIGGRLFDGCSPMTGAARLVCHCLLVEHASGLVLVDTGLGTLDVDAPHPRLSRFFTAVLRPRLARSETALAQIEQLGFSARDVRHIVVTHLDFDHAGGLGDFPEATVHVHEDELQAALNPRGWIARRRYRERQWSAGVRWKAYSFTGEHWHGFEAVRNLEGAPPGILLVPLAGHTSGHCGVAVQADEGWLLDAGDAYFYRDELKRVPACTPGLRLYQRMMEANRESRLGNQQRLRDLAARAAGIVNIFSAHDAVEFEQWAQVACSGAKSGAGNVRRMPDAGTRAVR